MNDAVEAATPEPPTPPSGRRGPRGSYAKSAQRRRQILDQVLAVFDEHGFDGTSLRAIADAVGVTHPVLKHHFGSREQLFLEVLAEHDRRFVDSVDDDEAPLGDLIRGSAEHSLAVPGLMALLHGMVARALEAGNEQSRAHFSERYAVLRGQVHEVLEHGRRAGRVRTDIPLEQAAALVLAAADGLSVQWLLDGGADLREGLLLLERLLAPPPG